MMHRSAVAALLLLAVAAAPTPSTPGPTYADLAALALVSPVIVRGTVLKAERLGMRDAPDVAAGTVRLLMRTRIAAAILTPDAVPATIDYLVELPLDARGKAPRLKGAAVLLFLRPGERPGQYVLTRGRAQVDATATAEASVRAVLAEARGGTVPVVTGIGDAFHVPGAVPGEAESQFFLTTQGGKPVSLVVLSRPGQDKALSLALGDVIDDAAAGVRRDTLLWYRLACFLPRDLPATVASDQREALTADYRFVLDSLGPCTRVL